MASSYEKVFRLLNNTNDARETRVRIGKAIREARVTGWTFKLQEYEGKPFVNTTFSTSFHRESDYKSLGYDGVRVAFVGLDPCLLADSTYAKEIVHRHFGHGVPTFFCRKEVVLNGCRGVRGRVDTQSFPDWFREELRTELRPEREEAEKRITEAVGEIVASQEFKEEQRRFFVRSAKDTLVASMRKYAGLGEEFMRDVVREFAVADVLEA